MRCNHLAPPTGKTEQIGELVRQGYFHGQQRPAPKSGFLFDRALTKPCELLWTGGSDGRQSAKAVPNQCRSSYNAIRWIFEIRPWKFRGSRAHLATRR